MISKDLKTNLSSEDSVDYTDVDEDEEPEGTLLLSDSLCRDMASTAEDLEVCVHGGAHYSTLTKYLKKRKTKVKDLYIVCGTNDIATKRPLTKVDEDCEKLIEEAKNHATNVFISNIPPRQDKKTEDENKNLDQKISTFNQGLQVLGNRLQVKVINHDSNFRFQDGSHDDSLLLSDGLHLATRGVNRLISNMELSDKVKCTFGEGPINKWKEKEKATSKGENKDSLPTLQTKELTPDSLLLGTGYSCLDREGNGMNRMTWWSIIVMAATTAMKVDTVLVNVGISSL